MNDFVGAKFYCLDALAEGNPAHSDWEEDAGVLVNSVIFNVSVPLAFADTVCIYKWYLLSGITSMQQ